MAEQVTGRKTVNQAAVDHLEKIRKEAEVKTPAAQEADARELTSKTTISTGAIVNAPPNGTPTEPTKPKKAPPTDQEWLTVRRVLGLLAGLPDDGARQRVVSYVAARFDHV